MLNGGFSYSESVTVSIIFLTPSVSLLCSLSCRTPHSVHGLGRMSMASLHGLRKQIYTDSAIGNLMAYNVKEYSCKRDIIKKSILIIMLHHMCDGQTHTHQNFKLLIAMDLQLPSTY